MSGKGGVGKTTIAAGLALAIARQHRRVAVIELGNDFIPERFGASPAGYTGEVIAPGVTALNITPRPAFEEYATRELKSHRLYSVMLDNRFVHYFLDATPGVNALLCLGKILHMLTEESWDCCVVDLPATGHGLGFLEVPRVVTNAVHLGPLRKTGEELCALLEDRETTTVLLTTHLEELPVNETIEMARRLTEPLQIEWGPVIANAVMAAPLTPEQVVAVATRTDPTIVTLKPVADFLHQRWVLQEQERQRLAKVVGRSLWEVPRYAMADQRLLMEAVAGDLARCL